MWFLVIIFVGLFIFIVYGAVSSYKNEKTRNKLTNASDYSFKTKNGSYSFNYMIKRLKSDTKKRYKVIIDPVLGFSDLVNTSDIGNTCLSVEIECADSTNTKVEKKEVKFDYNGASRTLTPNVEFSTELEFPISVTINSVWHFKRELNETLKFIMEEKGE